MKTKNYFLIILALFLSFSSFSQDTVNKKSKITIFDEMHWMIERSDMKTVIQKFDEYCRKNDFSSLVNGLKDGKYKGKTPADDYGYYHEISFEMKDGKMISIDYDEIHLDGHAKQNDVEYNKQMLKSGTSPAIAYPSYESQMLKKQDFNKIDGISGASYSLYRFKMAILYAMLNSEQLK